MLKRPKSPRLLELIREKVSTGRIRYSGHANQRMRERRIIKPEVEYVLRTGRHKKEKDNFNDEHNDWDYAIEGRTIDSRKLRIIVAIADPNLLVVTTIDLET